MNGMPIWDLKKGWTFRFKHDSKVLVFLGMDGAYAKCRALDFETNKQMCKEYDATSDFFAIMVMDNVILVDPLTLEDMELTKGKEINE